MSTYELVFEAMMADMTAPPLSLSEFRLFVAHDRKAQNALAFCEWYQRYRTVYFDRTAATTATLSSVGAWPDAPGDTPYPQPTSGAHRIESVQSLRSVQHDPAVFRGLSWKSHSVSALSESAAGSAAHTIGASSGGGSGARRVPVRAPVLEVLESWDAPPLCERPPRSTVKRYTVPNCSGSARFDTELPTQEECRRDIQSLLVFECWARFLCDEAREPVEIPKAEVLYVKERLPLNITHLPYPLLCHGDMLASELHPTTCPPSLPAVDGPNAHTVSCGRGNCSRPVRLRRALTMPNIGSGASMGDRSTQRVHGPVSRCMTPAPRPAHLMAVENLQRYHHALRPRPPFTTGTEEATGSLPLCGYRPVPKQVSKLIIPNDVPPALYETAAKISASHLLQHYFADFYAQAHYNLSATEQRIALVAASVLLVLGVGTAVTVAIAAVHPGWRVFAMPLLVGATLGLSAAWTRIGVWRWLLRTRPTSLIAQAPDGEQPGDEELLHGADRLDVDMRAVRSVTGTLWQHQQQQRPAGLAGTLAATSCLPDANCPPGVARNALDWGVRRMLRKHCAGDQWHIDLGAKRYRVLEPLVLRGQCYSVSHQAAVLAVVWCAAATAIFLAP
ncbi:hypothetical protein H4R19_004405 [Coemansia spiralis]|nr:hypothetical protein H4R19_004405 [Coemansia spiralis]